MKKFTEEELAKYNEKNGQLTYVGFKRNVRGVSAGFLFERLKQSSISKLAVSNGSFEFSTMTFWSCIEPENQIVIFFLQLTIQINITQNIFDNFMHLCQA